MVRNHGKAWAVVINGEVVAVKSTRTAAEAFEASFSPRRSVDERRRSRLKRLTEARSSKPAAPPRKRWIKPSVTSHRAGRVDYDSRREARIERLEARAAKAATEAQSRFAAEKAILDVIPMGQPILVGHHSEKGHRRDIDRARSHMAKGLEALRKSESLERRADVAKSNVAISSDDPKAVALITEKLKKLESERETYKRMNKERRKKGEESLPSYLLTNLGSEIRRLEKRRQELLKATARVERDDITVDDWTLSVNKRSNRVELHGPRPTADQKSFLKAEGWHWSPQGTCWQRMLSDSAIYSGERFLKLLDSSWTPPVSTPMKPQATPVNPESKPPGGQAAIDRMRQIVDSKKRGVVGGLDVDMYSASVVLSVYDRLNAKNQARFRSMHVRRMIQVAFKLVK
jgi:hypothetical protein